MRDMAATWQEDTRDAQKEARRIVFLMAVLATLLEVLYFIGLAGKLIVDGSIHSTSSQSVQIISAVVGLLLDVSLLILFVALRWQFPGRKAAYADLACVFMALVCATSSVNWFVQLAILPRLALAGYPTATLLDVHNTSSVMYAIEHLGWGVFYGLATIFMTIAIGDGKFGGWIRWLFVAGGTLSLLHVIGITIMNPLLSDLGYVSWGILLPAATILIAIRYRRP